MADEQVRVNLVVDGTDSATRAYEAFKRLSMEMDNLDSKGRKPGPGGKSGTFGLDAKGLMQVAYAADDLQYGFRAIVNNIPMILTGLGMGAGLAGAISVVSVGVNQLIQHWDGLTSTLSGLSPAAQQAASDLKTVADAADKLAAAQPRTLAVADMLARDSAMYGVASQFLTGATPQDAAYRQSMAESISSEDPKAIARIMAARKTAITDPKDVALLSQIDRFESGGGTLSKEQASVRAEILTRAREETEKSLINQMAAAATNPEARARLMAQTTEAIGGATGSDKAKLESFLLALEQGTPEAEAEWERVTNAAVESGQAAHRAMEASRKRDEAAEKAAEKQAKADADATKRRVDAQERENADRLKSWQNSPEHQQAIASDAMQRYNEAEFAYATAGNPQMARMLRQQQAMARRFGGANTSASIMQRQMMERLGGGSEAIAQRERAQEVMREASMTFKEAVEKLAREGLQVTL